MVMARPRCWRCGKLKRQHPPQMRFSCVSIASTVNSADVRTRKLEASGLVKLAMRMMLGWNKPRNAILGNVFAGTVAAAGEKVSGFKAGDEAFGCTHGMKFGCHAEYVVVTEKDPIALIPGNATFAEAAALLFGGTASLYFLEKTAPKAGEDILIYSSTGSVGTAAVQIAKALGLKVTAFSHEENRDFVAELGADVFYVMIIRAHPWEVFLIVSMLSLTLRAEAIRNS